MTPWSSTAATRWDGGVVAGTGVIGAVVFGEPRRHVAVLSHERFFAPANSRRPAPDLVPALAVIRGALAAGDERSAAEAVASRLRALGIDPDELVWTDPLAPIGQLVWSPVVGDVTDYRRQMDPDDLGVDITWRCQQLPMGLRIRAEHGLEGMSVELWSIAPVSGVLRVEPVVESHAGADTVETVDYSRIASSVALSAPNDLTLEVVAADGAERRVSARVSLSSDIGWPIIEDGWAVTIGAGETARFQIRVETDAPGPREAAALTFRSSRLALAAASADEHVEPLWERARAGHADAEARVLEIAYAAGLRNILASTGSLPPTLQGVWQGTWSPAWSADYTMNGNVQLGTMSAALWTGNAELLRALFRLVVQFGDDYRSNARAIFGAPGMLLPARLSTHGHANHFIRDYPHEFWTGHGGWLLRMAVDYIQVTGDDSLVDDWLWEYAVEILEFGLAVVADGDGHFSPSYSPENTPEGRDNPIAVDATSDIAALRDGLQVGAWLARHRGEALRAARWERARAGLPGYRVAEGGLLAEWAAPWADRIGHRHASQLHGLWYEPDDAFDDPELRAAAGELIRAKIAWRAEQPSGPPGHMEMAFGLSSLGLAAAALGDAESAYRCALWLARDHFTPALVSTHDAGAVFNLDASGALPAVVASMLLRSTIGEIGLLPALPLAWSVGSITGLTGRGGVLLPSLAWSPHHLEFALELIEDAQWMRGPTTRIVLPRPGRLRPTRGVSQLDPTTLEVAESSGQASFHIDFTFH